MCCKRGGLYKGWGAAIKIVRTEIMLAHITMLHCGNRDGGGLSNVNKRDSSVAAGSSLPIISELSVLQDGWDLKYLDDFRRRRKNISLSSQ